MLLQEVLTEEKGRGVAADQCNFQKGDFLCCYKGDLIDKAEGERRRSNYKEEMGSYLFFFKHNGKIYGLLHTFCVPLMADHSLHSTNSIDATKEDGSSGRLINHSKLRPNVEVKIVSDTRPYLCVCLLPLG